MSEPLPTSPWYMIWLHPRQAMRHILKNYPRHLVHTLAILGAFTQVVPYTVNAYPWWLIAVIWISFSILAGLAMLYILGGLLKWTGSWIRGQGSYEDIRAAIAWSQVPVIAFFIIESLVLLLFKGNGGNVVFASILFVFKLWAAIIFLCCLAEAQRFSFVRALVNYILSAVIVIAVAVIITVIVTVFSPENTLQTNPQKT